MELKSEKDIQMKEFEKQKVTTQRKGKGDESENKAKTKEKRTRLDFFISYFRIF